MSLTIKETQATKKELKANWELSKVTFERAAKDLHSSPEHVKEVLNLNPSRIEEPWVLRNYLNQLIIAKGNQPHAYSRLNGSPKVHWFLDNRFIEKGKLAK